MNAGRELDAAIAEKVMGWNAHYKLPPGERPTHEGEEHYYDPISRMLYLPSQWSPSTDISAALDVKRRMVEDGFSFSLFESRTGAIRVSFICPAGPCEKHGNFQHNHHGAYDVEADTVPLAICEAALIALKVSVEKS